VSLIRVNPDSVRQYGSAAQQQFDAVRAELQALVDDAVTVRYFGPNAVEFKTRSGEMASDFARRLARDLGQIAEAVRTSTTAIAQSLGGGPISVSVDGAPIPLPQVPAADGSVEVDTSGLEALKPRVAGHIDAITTQLDAHLRNLQNTDWQGQAKESAVSAVTGFTNAARSLATEARTSITSSIDRQIDMVLAGDR
jgi:uncharacterized protein YukE